MTIKNYNTKEQVHYEKLRHEIDREHIDNNG